MKIIGISSSGRKASYSKRIVKNILEESGIDYEMIHLAELDIKGCLGCLKCAKNNKCVQNDDFQAIVNKINEADALVFGGSNYYGVLNAIGHVFWERTFSLRHRESFLFAGKLGIAVGLNRDSDKQESTKFIEKMMLSNKMAVIATFTDSGHEQCYDCGFGHNCVVGNVFANMGLTTSELAEKNRPVEYGIDVQNKAKAIGKMLGSILSARKNTKVKKEENK